VIVFNAINIRLRETIRKITEIEKQGTGVFSRRTKGAQTDSAEKTTAEGAEE